MVSLIERLQSFGECPNFYRSMYVTRESRLPRYFFNVALGFWWNPFNEDTRVSNFTINLGHSCVTMMGTTFGLISPQNIGLYFPIVEKIGIIFSLCFILWFIPWLTLPWGINLEWSWFPPQQRGFHWCLPSSSLGRTATVGSTFSSV